MPESRRVYLHLGLQKTGTSYLQGVMRVNQDRLAEQGLDLVPAERREAFELMLLVRGRYNPDRDPASVGGALDRFAEQVRRAPGSRALLSQESLAASRRSQVRSLVEACGDREVHVVLTVRDLARQVPSSWQQELKAGRTVTYERWLERLQEGQRAGQGGHPWIQLDPPAVLARWAEVVPADRIHVVTVPPPGSPPTLLLERYCRVLGVSPDSLAPGPGAGNTSLGRVHAELLRQVNLALPDDLRRRQVYGDVGKRWFASQVLAGRTARPDAGADTGPGTGPDTGLDTELGGGKILVPAGLRDWCEEVADAQVKDLAEAGYHVEGSLEDLRCRDAAFSDTAAESPSESELRAAAVGALARVITLRATSPRRRGGPPATGLRGRVRRVLRRLGRTPRGQAQEERDR